MADAYKRYYVAETESRDLFMRLGQFIDSNHSYTNISRELFKSAVSEVEKKGIRLLSQFYSFLYNSTNIVIFDAGKRNLFLHARKPCFRHPKNLWVFQDAENPKDFHHIQYLNHSDGGALMILGETQDKIDDTAKKLNLPLETMIDLPPAA